MERDEILEKLRVDGYVVIPNVLTTEQCEEHAKSYQRWYKIFKENTPDMKQRHSVIQTYRVGHFNTTWKIRLQVQPVFEMVWGTKKLLTSVDGIAVSMPPETGESQFRAPGDCWLHLDQSDKRRGLHAYQGAVYLEETTDKDYCFRVLEGSHEYHTAFFQAFPKPAEKAKDHHRLSQEERNWYEENGCRHICVPVPKGGIVLWDSRTAHDTVAPLSGRPNTDRWRSVCFVSMTPAIWAGKEDLEFKKKVYADIAMTSHWSSQGQMRFPNDLRANGIISIRTLPAVAKTKEVKRLMGVENYNFHDGQPNGPPEPAWR